MEQSAEGDLLVIGKSPTGSILVLVVRAGTTVENNVLWLFDIADEGGQTRFEVKEIEEKHDPQLNFASRTILSALGIDVTDTDENYLEIMLEKFGGKFPTTRIFSAFARGTLLDVSAKAEPDRAVIAWMEREEILFRTLERYFVSKKLEAGFDDVDSFIS